jgi:hypothetical protein
MDRDKPVDLKIWASALMVSWMDKVPLHRQSVACSSEWLALACWSAGFPRRGQGQAGGPKALGFPRHRADGVTDGQGTAP